MIMGYAILAVPTGIVSVELSRASSHHPITPRSCVSCGAEGHAHDAKFCMYCGEAL
jgi:voltage-gated potassium channel